MLDVWPDGGGRNPRRNFESRLKKLKPFEAQGGPRRVVPGYSDLDANGHVNNTRYASWALDALDFCGGGRVKSMQIDYRRELQRGQAVDVFSRRDEKTARAEGVTGDGERAFSAAIELF